MDCISPHDKDLNMHSKGIKAIVEKLGSAYLSSLRVLSDSRSYKNPLIIVFIVYHAGFVATPSFLGCLIGLIQAGNCENFESFYNNC